MFKLIPGVCTQCGATLSVEQDKDRMICPYCNTSFIVEKAVRKFNNTYIITNHIGTQNVYYQGKQDTGFQISGGVLTKYTGAAVDVVVPENVIAIGMHAFAGLMIHRVTLPRGLQKIDQCAFERCAALREIIIPEGVTTIGEKAFINCSALEKVTIPKSVSLIASMAFSLCNSLKSLTIPGNGVCLTDYCFNYSNNLTSLTLPSTFNASSLFLDNCPGLTNITVGHTSLNQADFNAQPWKSIEYVPCCERIKQARKDAGLCPQCGGRLKGGLFSDRRCTFCGTVVN